MKTVLTKVQFLERFTPQEVAALMGHVTSGNVTACNVLMRFIAIERIHSDSELLTQMMTALVQLGVLTEQRRAAVMDFGA
ncbi:MAG: hypothetical protein HS117_19430 [Verrucomicrobiaceae bacterium]|nr:hypothetical protein [Verrucomicrobiaceae bacterium]